MLHWLDGGFDKLQLDIVGLYDLLLFPPKSGGYYRF